MQCVDPVVFKFEKRFFGGGGGGVNWLYSKVVYGVVWEVEMFVYEGRFVLVYARAVVIDSSFELCGCVANILFSTFGASYKVDYVVRGTCEGMSDGKPSWVARVVRFKSWGAV